ncbi:hypothetical protein DBR06_SOUSAS6610019, partial [Sousa chinensis]
TILQEQQQHFPVYVHFSRYSSALGFWIWALPITSAPADLKTEGNSERCEPRGPPGPPSPPGPLGIAGPQGHPGKMGQRGSPGATERCPLPPKSAFFVKLSEPLPKPFQPVVFKEALYNQQDHFNLTAGVFSCTTPGVYNFAFDNEMFQRSVKIGLMRNGIRVRWKQAQAKDSHKHALGTVIVQLEKEDKVWLESKLNEAESEKETPQMMFFGYLLYGN